MARGAGKALGKGDPFFLRLVGQHGAADDIADGVDPFGAGSKAVVDRNIAPWVRLDADRLQIESVGGGTSANGHEHDIGLDGSSRAVSHGLDLKDDVVRLHSRSDHLVRQAELEALGLEHLVQRRRHL